MSNEVIVAIIWVLAMSAFLLYGCLREAKEENKRLKKELEERGGKNV